MTTSGRIQQEQDATHFPIQSPNFEKTSFVRGFVGKEMHEFETEKFEAELQVRTRDLSVGSANIKK